MSMLLAKRPRTWSGSSLPDCGRALLRHGTFRSSNHVVHVLLLRDGCVVGSITASVAVSRFPRRLPDALASQVRSRATPIAYNPLIREEHTQEC